MLSWAQIIMGQHKLKYTYMLYVLNKISGISLTYTWLGSTILI